MNTPEIDYFKTYRVVWQGFAKIGQGRRKIGGRKKRKTKAQQ